MYLDLVLILNMAVNYFLLRLTALFYRQEGYFYGILLAAFIAALFPLLIYLVDIPALLIWATRLLLPLLMIYISFRPRHFRQGFCQYLIFYLCSISLGGLALLFSAGTKIPYGGGEAYLLAPPSLLMMLVAVLLLYGGMRWLYPLLQEMFHFKVPPATLKMEVYFNGKSKVLNGFVDTGNMLCCPFSGIPVAVASYRSICELLPREICFFLQHERKIDWFNLEKYLSGQQSAAKFSLIPYHSLGEKGFLLAFRPDRVDLREEGGGEVVHARLMIGVQQEADDRADYEVLLPLEAWRSVTAAKKERKIALT